MRIINFIILSIAITACSGKSVSDSAKYSNADSAATQTWPEFNADSAYFHIVAQVSFGPRVPGSKAHADCRQYLEAMLNRYGADTIITQDGSVSAFDGATLPLHNIYARFNSSAERRILLAAHYDTRPWADQDSARQHAPIDGANDGASGVGVILELARLISRQSPNVGIDIFFTDVEDYGTPEFGESNNADSDDSSSWCLGSQYWAKSKPFDTLPNRPVYGILLDMVGGLNASFCREYFSERNAAWLNQKVWQAAKEQGASRFVDECKGAVTDDHIYISSIGIPCIDIIECANPQTGAFPPSWHTHADNLQTISTATLSDVGTTLARVIYTEQ